MEKLLYKTYNKRGELSLTFLPNTFMIGYTQSGGYRYLVLGCITIEWFSYK